WLMPGFALDVLVLSPLIYSKSSKVYPMN
ncbi:MAG: hypothetical protein ACI9XB_005096, partial [Gammaproteobacteria bacterium]